MILVGTSSGGLNRLTSI